MFGRAAIRLGIGRHSSTFYSIAIFNLADFAVTEKSCKMARVGLSP